MEECILSAIDYNQGGTDSNAELHLGCGCGQKPFWRAIGYVRGVYRSGLGDYGRRSNEKMPRGCWSYHQRTPVPDATRGSREHGPESVPAFARSHDCRGGYNNSPHAAEYIS